MTKRLYQNLIIVLILLATVGLATAQDVTLSWDASPSAEVAGYKVYYKQGSPFPPFDGIGASQGPSPVDAGDQLSTTLTNLPDDSLFYFTVTAYDGEGNESVFSNIVSNSWIPELLTPAQNAVNEPVPATFQWTTEPNGNMNYTLYYGTDEQMVTDAGAVPFPGDHGNRHVLSPEIIVLLLVLSIICLLPRRKKTVLVGCALATALALSGCTSSGGGGDSSSDKSATTSDPAATVYAVDKGPSDYHQAYDLEPGTTYYWKVVAVDPSAPSQNYSSRVSSFTTEVF